MSLHGNCVKIFTAAKPLNQRNSETAKRPYKCRPLYYRNSKTVDEVEESYVTVKDADEVKVERSLPAEDKGHRQRRRF